MCVDGFPSIVNFDFLLVVVAVVGVLVPVVSSS